MQDIYNQPKTDIKVLFACRFPPPYTGETIAARLTFDLLKNEFQCERFNIVLYRAVGMAGKFSFMGMFQTLRIIFKLRDFVKKNNFDILYFVPASSMLGHIRDILLVYFVRKHVFKIVGHIRSGNFQDILQKKVLSSDLVTLLKFFGQFYNNYLNLQSIKILCKTL